MHAIFEGTRLDLRPLLAEFKWGFSREVIAELQDFGYGPNSFIPFSEAIISPVSAGEIKALLKKYPWLADYDKADQSLIVVAIRDGGVVLTDDGGLLIDCQALRIPAFRLPDFCLRLVAEGDLRKNEMGALLKYWETVHRYSKKEIKRWKSILQTL